MSQNDSGFYKPFVFVLGALVLFTVFIGFMAVMFSPASDRDSDPLVRQSTLLRINPVGNSRLADSEGAVDKALVDEGDSVVAVVADVPAPSAPQTGVASTETADSAVDSEADAAPQVEIENESEAAKSLALSAEEVPLRVRAIVATNCAGCHAAGVHGAPLSDDPEIWESLAGKGMFALTTSVVNGSGIKRPRAETDLSDEEVDLAIRLMIGQAIGAEQGAKSTTVANTNATAVVVQQLPETNKQVDVAASEAEGSDSATDTRQTDSSGGEFPDQIKMVVDTACAACHTSGVAKAPKFGDREDWQKRLQGGIDVLLASAIAGKGSMPPRGGSQLSDAELKLAIEYMISK